MKKILVANRGEIACRILRTIRHMGLLSVAVYSEPDRAAPHVQQADEAIAIGPAAAAESYLNQKKILDAARESGADAIHPGYGFLSENPGFANLVEDAGLIFIGPTSASMEIMGSKLAAKKAVKSYDIPLVPGHDQAIADVNEASAVAGQIGYPILIKASAGGGGKGMRIVHHPDALASEFDRAQSEALSAFGDGAVFVERYIAAPRHIEIQVLADKFGKTLHLFERECSIQRRHQKVIEEAPSVVLTPKLRAQMGAAAVRVAQACDYHGAGTVEFLLDEQGQFFFLEMNTRLQVEHPVTELITGLDLVEQQIRIARGEHLALNQEDIHLNGHAIELRVYAEDPYNNFLPSTGRLVKYQPPAGPGVRVDDGYAEGMDIPIHYDPLIAKLIACGTDRRQAVQRLIQAIDDYQIEGPATTLPFGTFVLGHGAFLAGDIDTHFVEKHFTPEAILQLRTGEAELAAKLALRFLLDKQRLLTTVQPSSNQWKSARR